MRYVFAVGIFVWSSLPFAEPVKLADSLLIESKSYGESRKVIVALPAS